VSLSQHQCLRIGATALAQLEHREGRYPRLVPPKDGLRRVGQRCIAELGCEQPQRFACDTASAQASIVMDVKDYRIHAGRRATRVSRKADVRAQVPSLGNKPAHSERADLGEVFQVTFGVRARRGAPAGSRFTGPS
jgi:hypothetical protein